MKICFALMVIIFGVCNLVQAEYMVAPSLEWLADHCIESGIYVVSDIKEEENKDSVTLSLTLKKGLRGPPSKEIKQRYYKIKLIDPESVFVKKGDEFLICFQHHKTGEKSVIQNINLDNPQIRGYSDIAATSDLKILKSKKDILKVFEDRLKLKPKGDPVESGDFSKDNRFELKPSYGELFYAVFGGSACDLRVPKDLEKKAIAESARLEKEFEKAIDKDKK
jgi:hypothetical protein